MTTTFFARVGVAAIGLALVVGCGGDGADTTSATLGTTVPATTTSSTSTTTAPAPTTTSTTVAPDATGSPLTTRSRLHSRGIGPVHAGMTVREAAQVAGVTLAIEAFDAFDGFCYYAVPEGLDGLSFMVGDDGTRPADPLDGTIVRAEARQPTWQTLAGVHPGSTEADVVAAYGNAVETEPHTYQAGGHYLTVPGTGADAGFGIRFETSRELVVENIFSGNARSITAVEGCA